MPTIGELTGNPLPRYRIEGETANYYATAFPDPNGRAALWKDDDNGGITVYDSLDTAMAAVGADDHTPASFYHTRPFVLRRYKDVSGRSGTGIPAVGIEFPDGTCAMGWLTDVNSVAVYGSLSDVEDIHGHGGKTKVNYLPTR